jgi:hypothetical protein
MASPVGGINFGSGDQELKARIQQWIQDEVRAAFAGGLGIHVDGTTGDLVADQGNFRSNNYVAGVSGWGMKPSGNAEFNDMTIRGGIIGNDALVSPVVPAPILASTSGFAVTVAPSIIVTTGLTVPTGITKAVVIVSCWSYVNNNAGVPVILDLNAVVNGTGTGVSEVTFGTGVAGSIPPSIMSPLVTGLVAGGTLTVQGQLASTMALTASASNRAGLSGAVLWFR